jgi:hypothetical protein
VQSRSKLSWIISIWDGLIPAIIVTDNQKRTLLAWRQYGQRTLGAPGAVLKVSFTDPYLSIYADGSVSVQKGKHVSKPCEEDVIARPEVKVALLLSAAQV